MEWLQRIREKRRRRAMFGGYVAEELVGRLERGPASVSPCAAGARELTMFFASIDSFVTLAEALPPRRLLSLVNAYFEDGTGAIAAAGGVVDTLIGDTLVARFGEAGGAGEERGHALAACRAALAFKTRFVATRAQWETGDGSVLAKLPEVRIRIGINTGAAIVRNWGNAKRFDYSAGGDAVNVARRIEEAMKAYGVWIACSEHTKQACEAEAPGRVVFRALGRLSLRETADLELFEVVGLRDAA